MALFFRRYLYYVKNSGINSIYDLPEVGHFDIFQEKTVSDQELSRIIYDSPIKDGTLFPGLGVRVEKDKLFFSYVIFASSLSCWI